MSETSEQPDGDETVAVRVVVRGQVQGVAFRHHAMERAQELGLVGWVRNEADGTVSAHLEGERDAVDAMVAWCQGGPSSASVEGVDEREAEPHGASSFEVRG